MTNHVPEQSGNGEAAFGVLVLWMVFILSLLELEASPFCPPLTLTSRLWSLREPPCPLSPGLLKAHIIPELCFTVGAFKSSNPT